MFLKCLPNRLVLSEVPEHSMCTNGKEKVVSWVQENEGQDTYHSHVVHIIIFCEDSYIRYYKVKESQVFLFGDSASSVQREK